MARKILKSLVWLLILHLSITVQSASAADQPPTTKGDADKPGDTTQASQAPSQAAKPKPKPKPIKLETEEDYWIDPDRPHIADSSVNVPKGLWLQENGFQQSYLDPRTGVFDFPQTLIRLGIANRTELRYNVPDFMVTKAGSKTQSGFQNMQVGFKHRLGPLGPTKFQIAVNPYISIPTGFARQSSHVDPFIKFPYSQELNERWDIEGMESLFDPTDPGGHHNLDWQNSFVLNRSWGRQKNAYVEYVGDLFQHGPMSNLIHFGAAYRPNRREQFDTQFGFRMNNAAPIAFFGFGYSFLLGNLETPRLTPSHFEKGRR